MNPPDIEQIYRDLHDAREKVAGIPFMGTRGGLTELGKTVDTILAGMMGMAEHIAIQGAALEALKPYADEVVDDDPDEEEAFMMAAKEDHQLVGHDTSYIADPETAPVFQHKPPSTLIDPAPVQAGLMPHPDPRYLEPNAPDHAPGPPHRPSPDYAPQQSPAPAPTPAAG
jgi:hypothetical protein